MLVCSFVAGSSARTITSPLDVAKIIIAVHKSAKTVTNILRTYKSHCIIIVIYADDLGHGASQRRARKRESFPFLVQRQRHGSVAVNSIFSYSYVGDAVSHHALIVQKS